MGKRGPKPRPRAIVILEGNMGRRPLVPDDLEVTSDMPLVKPDFVLDRPVASSEWDRVVEAMPPGIYSALDANVIAQYALSWDLLREAQREIDEHGMVAWTEFGPRANPAVAMWKSASETLLKCGDRLGLNPSVRARMQLPKRKETPAQGRFGGLLGRT